MGLAKIASILKMVAPLAGDKKEALLLVAAILEMIAEEK